MTSFSNVSPKHSGLNSPEGLLIQVFLSLCCRVVPVVLTKWMVLKSWSVSQNTVIRSS